VSPKKPNPTQKDVARQAGVSQSAVSRVFAGHGYVASEVREQIATAAKLLGYVPDVHARTLVTGQSNSIALVTTNLTHPFVHVLLEKLSIAVRARGREVLLLNALPGQDIDALLPLALTYKVRGILIVNVSLGDEALAQARARRVPLVMINRYVEEDRPAHAIACDSVAGGAVIADALLDAGKQRIAFVGGLPSSATNAARKRGFLDRLGQRGVAPVFAADGSFSHSWGYEAARTLQALPEQVDAVFCGDDLVALGMLDGYRHLEGRGPVPSVVGFDDIPQASWPAYLLTTFQNPLDAIIARALEVLELPPGEPTVRELFPGELIRRSTF
jgi:DNA-binding LacI/PurR family transcriptional regulator